MNNVPSLELSDFHRSPFDEAVIIIGDREEHTITIECENALDLADVLIRLFNNHAAIVAALESAAYALRSFEQGHGAPDLARLIADRCEALSKDTGIAA